MKSVGIALDSLEVTVCLMLDYASLGEYCQFRFGQAHLSTQDFLVVLPDKRRTS
jgi:hypothetical protein